MHKIKGEDITLKTHEDIRVINLESFDAQIVEFEKQKEEAQKLCATFRGFSKPNAPYSVSGLLIVDNKDIIVPFAERAIASFNRIYEAFGDVDWDSIRSKVKEFNRNKISDAKQQVYSYLVSTQRKRSQYVLKEWDPYYNKLTDDIDKANDDINVLIKALKKFS